MNDNSIWSASGAPISASMAREQLWLTTGGRTGIIGPDSLEVVPQETPNNTVRINPGSFAIAATSDLWAIGYTSAPWQSYGRSLQDPITVPIESTGSSGGRTDVVGIVIKDPEWDGLELTEEQLADHWFWDWHVARNVGNSATRPEHFAGLGRPFLPLAQIKLGPNTGTIEESMITDLRVMAISRSETEDLLSVANDDTTFHTVLGPNDTSWQDVHTFDDIPIPWWATVAKISMMIGPVYTRQGAANGEFRLRNTGLRAGNWHTRSSLFVEPDHTEQTGGSQRIYLHTAGVFDISRSNQGGSATINLQVRRTGGPGEFVIPSSSHFTCRVVGRVTFEESARRWG